MHCNMWHHRQRELRLSVREAHEPTDMCVYIYIYIYLFICLFLSYKQIYTYIETYIINV